eukprot:scaffold438149_cov38-Prasinocladus_malaysianus.AAC.1
MPGHRPPAQSRPAPSTPSLHHRPEYVEPAEPRPRSRPALDGRMVIGPCRRGCGCPGGPGLAGVLL